MSRQNFGTLRGRRGGSGAWQWTVIGFVLGFGCAAIIGLVLIISSASGLVNLDSFFAASRPTQTPIVITNTPPRVTPTLLPTEELLPSATTVSQVAVQPPTSTPTTDPNLVQVEPSATPTTAVVPTQSLAASAPTIPSLLAGVISALKKIDGTSTFDMGTTAQEVATAVDECIKIYKGSCDIAMGQDSSPPHRIILDAYQMEETEVTYRQYLAFLTSMGANSHRTGCDGQLCVATRAEDEHSNIIFDTANYRVNDTILDYPVAGVTWYGAEAYCKAIGRRLPTEAEWEHAARGDNNALYPWGSNTFDVTLARTSRPIETDTNLMGAKPIHSYSVDSYGLYDMAGNVAEWVYDWYSQNYYTQLAQGPQPIPPNPQGPPAGTEKVVRGGSWADQPFFARAVQRTSLVPSDHSLSIGFRCAANADTGTGAPAGNTSAPLTVATPGTSGTSSSSEEETANSQPTLPPPPLAQPTTSLATLAPGG
jgi:formylglycine-generating enzyme required for sulfatase activity